MDIKVLETAYVISDCFQLFLVAFYHYFLSDNVTDNWKSSTSESTC